MNLLRDMFYIHSTINHTAMLRIQPALTFLISCCSISNVANAQQTVMYEGTFLNMQSTTGGTLRMSVNYWPNDSVSGYADFTEFPGGQLLCGAGFFTGVQVADSIYHEFVSQDEDPGCGFDWGFMFFLHSQVHNGLDSISGAYKLDDLPDTDFLGTYSVVAVGVTGLSDLEDVARVLSVHPNPTAGLLAFDPGNLDPVRIRFFDAIGREVLRHDLQASTGLRLVDTSTLTPGSYTMLVEGRQGLKRYARIIKQYQ